MGRRCPSPCLFRYITLRTTKAVIAETSPDDEPMLMSERSHGDSRWWYCASHRAYFGDFCIHQGWFRHFDRFYINMHCCTLLRLHQAFNAGNITVDVSCPRHWCYLFTFLFSVLGARRGSRSRRGWARWVLALSVSGDETINGKTKFQRYAPLPWP